MLNEFSRAARGHHRTALKPGSSEDQRPGRQVPLLVAAMTMLLMAAGCATESDSRSSADRSSAPGRGAGNGSDLAQQVEQRYVIGPSAAREMGYRIDWQYPSVLGHRIAEIKVEGDSVFTLDDENFLSRFDRESGNRFWRVQVAEPLREILGITYVPRRDRVFLTSGGDLLVIDAATGNLIGRQKLQKIANTRPIVFDQFLIYGSRGGELVWHSYHYNSYWRGYKIAQSIQIPPVYSGGYVVVVGNDGRIMCLVAADVSQVWSQRALGEVVASPVADDGIVFVPSLDQHLYAYDLGRARQPRLWRYLSESPLTDSPTPIGDRVYQQIPAEGLVSFEAAPLDQPGGVIVWRAEGVGGNVLTQLGDDLITWDTDERLLVLVDRRFGSEVKSLRMPQVDKLIATDVQRGELYATGMDGRLIRLHPRQ